MINTMMRLRLKMVELQILDKEAKREAKKGKGHSSSNLVKNHVKFPRFNFSQFSGKKAYPSCHVGGSKVGRSRHEVYHLVCHSNFPLLFLICLMIVCLN